MVTAEQIMTKEVLFIGPDASILDVVRILTDKRISGLPVADRDRALVGVITEKDVLKLLFEDDAKTRFVKDFMTRGAMTFKTTDTIDVICRFFIKSTVRRVPILNDRDELVGIISRRDIISEIKRIKGI